MCGARHKEMKNLSVRTMRCECGNVMGRDRNAAVNHYRYPKQWENRGMSPTRLEIGDHAETRSVCGRADGSRRPPVPVAETRMLATVFDHENQ